MPIIIDARNIGGGSIGSSAGGDTSVSTRNNVALAAPWDESKEYFKGDLVTDDNNLYQAQKSVPVGVKITDEDYWHIVIIGDKPAVQANLEQNDEAARDYVKGRTHWAEEKAIVNVPILTNTIIKYYDDRFGGIWRYTGAPTSLKSLNLQQGTTVYVKAFDTVFTKQLEKMPRDNVYKIDLGENTPIVNGHVIPSTYEFDVLDDCIYMYGKGSSASDGISLSISADVEQEVVHTIDSKYLPVFKAYLVRVLTDDFSQGTFQLAGGVTIEDLIMAFDEGIKVIVSLDNIEYELAEYESLSDLDNYEPELFFDFHPNRYTVSSEVFSFQNCAEGALLHHLEYTNGLWRVINFYLDLGFEAEYYTLTEIMERTYKFWVPAFICDKDSNKLYLQTPDFISDTSPSLTFNGIVRRVTDSNDNIICPLGTYNHIVTFNTANNEVDWDNPVYDRYVRLDGPTVYDLTQYSGSETQTALLCDAFGYPLSSYDQLGIDDQIEYNHHRYSYRTGQDSTSFELCYDSIKYNKAVNGTDIVSPQISTITVNRMRNTISVENFKPMLPETTTSEVLTAVDDIFGAPV